MKTRRTAAIAAMLAVVAAGAAASIAADGTALSYKSKVPAAYAR